MTIYYCYDAYCGWCYGFTTVINQLWEKYKDHFFFEVLSGGMIPKESAKHISTIAPFISKAYKQVEETTGITFGSDFLWHIFNPQDSDWFPHSDMAATALCIFKEYKPLLQVPFATDVEYALNYEGRDLTDPEAYRHLVEKYDLDETDFFKKLSSQEYLEKAQYEYALCKQLQVNGYPQLLLQVSDTKFYLLAKGYSSFKDIEMRLLNIIKEIQETTK